MASTGTPATAALARAGIRFETHHYALDELGGAEATYGEAVAAALGVDPARLFKTLVAEVDGKPVVGIVPVKGRLNLKALASAAGGKRARMAEPAAAERATGYTTGGISPFGQKRRLPIFVDATLSDQDTVFVSGGLRGLQVELRPEDLLAQLAGTSVPGLGS